MPGEISLVFLGGIADSGKSDLKPLLEKLPGVKWINISSQFKTALGEVFHQDFGEDNVALDYVEWKSRAEERALQLLGDQIKELKREFPEFNTLIINTHFATYSPGGFLPGLDPPHIKRICEFCHLLLGKEQNEISSDKVETVKGRAAVILVDIAISDVLQRREDRWKHKPQRSPSTGPGLIQDLELNRLYALQYFNVLSQTLGPDRVSYYRVLMDWKNQDTRVPVDQTKALQLAFKELQEFLDKEKIVSRQEPKR